MHCEYCAYIDMRDCGTWEDEEYVYRSWLCPVCGHCQDEPIEFIDDEIDGGWNDDDPNEWMYYDAGFCGARNELFSREHD